MLGPAEHEAENVARAWWAGCDIQWRWRHWESGNAHWASSAFSADFGVAEASLAKAASDGPLQAWRREETLPQGLLLGAVARHRWGCATYGFHASVGMCVCVRGDGRSNSAVVLLAGFARKHLELDQDVLVRICEWGKGRTMLRLEAKCFQ